MSSKVQRIQGIHSSMYCVIQSRSVENVQQSTWSPLTGKQFVMLYADSRQTVWKPMSQSLASPPLHSSLLHCSALHYNAVHCSAQHFFIGCLSMGWTHFTGNN